MLKSAVYGNATTPGGPAGRNMIDAHGLVTPSVLELYWPPVVSVALQMKELFERLPFCEPVTACALSGSAAPGRTRATFDGPCTVTTTRSGALLPVLRTVPPPPQAPSARTLRTARDLTMRRMDATPVRTEKTTSSLSRQSPPGGATVP